jgi:glycosyltransferase involved in cell wall biosynthesis
MAVLARLRGLPVVVHYHGSLPDVLARASAITEWGLSKLARSASINIGITRGSVALLDRVTGGKAVFIANFIEDDMVDAPRSQAVRPRPAAVYVGECSVDKGTLDLLDAARRVPGMDFLVVGGAKPGVRDALSAAPANVTHVGPVPRNAVLDFLRNGDLFVFPSRREGFPIAVLEAMAAGLPVVCTRVGALGEVVDEGLGGRFVTPGDVSGLAHELQILAASPELRTRMGTWNRRTCAEKYLFTTIAAELCALYDRLTPATARRIDAALAASPPRRGNEGRLRGRAL